MARIARRPKLTAPANAIDASCSQQGVGSRPELGVCSRLRQLVRCAERVAESWRAHRDCAAQSSANVNRRGLRSSPFISVAMVPRVSSRRPFIHSYTSSEGSRARPSSDARTGHEASATAAARFAVSCGGRINNASCAGAGEKIAQSTPRTLSNSPCRTRCCRRRGLD